MASRQQPTNHNQLALRRIRRETTLRPSVRPRSRPLSHATSEPAKEVNINTETDLVNQTSTSGRWAVAIILLSSLVWAAGFVIGFQAALSINMILALILAAVGLLQPGIGLIAIGMLAAIDAIASQYILTGGILRFNTVNYWLVIVIALNIPFLLRLRDLNSRTLQLFLVLIGLQTIYSANVGEGIQDVLNIVTTFGIVVYFARALNDRSALYWLGIVLGILAGLGGLVFFVQFNSLPYANPNNWTYFQLTALFAICISFHYAVVLGRGKLVLMILALINFAWVFLSGSRGSLLIALLAIVYMFLASRSMTWRTLMVAAALLIGVWVSTSFAEQEIYTITRIQMLFDENISESRRTSRRSLLARAGIDIFMENPMGIGTGSFREKVAQTAYLQSDRPAHSAWIKTLAENGVFGILLMVAFIASYAIMGIRNHQQGLLLYGFFITITLAAAFIAKEFQGKSLWFLTASGIVLLNADQIKELLNRKTRRQEVDNGQKLRAIRYGRKK